MPIKVTLGTGNTVVADIETDFATQVLSLKFRGIMETEKTLQDVGDYLNGARADFKTVLIDLSEVTRINSSGVRSWLEFMKRVQGFPFAYRITAVSEFFLEQANSKPYMLGKKPIPIETFESPYFCDACSRREVRVLKTSEMNLKAPKISAPPASCGSCGKGMRLDESEEYYFQFLRRL